MPWREAARRRLHKTAERVAEEVEAVLDEFAPEVAREIRLEPLTIDVTDPSAVNSDPPAQS